MDIVVDAVIAVLQVLPFGDTVRCNQHVDLRGTARHEHVHAFRYGREACQHGVHIRTETGNGGFPIHAAGYHCSMQAVFMQDECADIRIQIVGGIRERGEY